MITCREQCGAQADTEDAAYAAGWSCLAIAGGFRCGACVRLLLEVSALQGTDGVTEDTLPPGSRGALPKETASTITPPVRGL